MIGMHTEERSRLAANRRKYEETVADINEEVDKKNARARNSLEAANRGLTGRLAGLYKDREKVQDEIRRLEHEIRGSRVRAELERARANLASINFAIDNMEQVVALGKANTAHMSATLAETGARKRYDDALASRQDDDNDVHADMRHKGDVFSFAVSIENSTRDRLRDAMQRREEVLSLRVGEAQEKLNRLRKPTSNLDFMSAEAIDKMRKDMEAKASADIMKVFE